MKRTVLSLSLASVLVLSGCGGGSEDAEAKKAISTYLMDQQQEQEVLALEQGEADCISEDMVDGIGVEKLKEYGFLNEDGTVNEDDSTDPEMAQGDAEVMVDAIFDCADVMTTVRDEMTKSMGDVTPEMKECFDEALSDDLVRGMLVASFTGKEDQATQELTEPLMKCALGGMDLPQQ